ncbi:MAG: carboxypeptidase-like regulatory domain-containing protein [Planctomycetota bacterium]
MPNVRIGTKGALADASPSDATGNFVVESSGTSASIVAADDTFVTVLAGDWTRDSTIPPVVVVAQAIAVAGTVVEGIGAPVPGSQLVLQLPVDFDSRFPMPLDRAGYARWHTISTETGAFALPRLPCIDGASLLVTADAFAPLTVPLPMADERNLQIVLQRFRYEAGELTGRVVDPAGSPVGSARVAMGVTSVATDSDGKFGLSLRRAGWPTAIVAAKAGYTPARLEVPRNGGKQRGDWPTEVVLRLGPAPQSVRGRVVDRDKNGIAGAEVWINDPTPLGVAGMLPLQLEYLIAGGEVPRQAARMQVPFADDPTQDSEVMTQNGRPQAPTACWFYVTTNAEGLFELPGLLDRSYSLKALDPKTGLFGEASAVTGGSYQEIAIDSTAVWSELRGRVVSMQGKPMAGVHVEQAVVAHQIKARIPGGHFEGSALRQGQATTTAADGSFVLRSVGNHSCRFELFGDAIVPTHVRGDSIADNKNCLFTVEARCHVEVVLQDPDEADAVLCVDAQGEQLDLVVLRGNSAQFLTDLELHNGRSGLFVVGERAATLRLLRNGAPVRQIAFTPDPARTVTVQ